MVTVSKGWTIVYMAKNAIKYAYNENQWVTYDDQETIAQKVWRDHDRMAFMSDHRYFPFNFVTGEIRFGRQFGRRNVLVD